MPEHPTDAHFSFTFVFKQALTLAHPMQEIKSATRDAIVDFFLDFSCQ